MSKLKVRLGIFEKIQIFTSSIPNVRLHNCYLLAGNSSYLQKQFVNFINQEIGHEI
jgi:hypothetical protein